MVKGDFFFFGRSQPAPAASSKEPSHVNAASRARERLKLKGRPSTERAEDATHSHVSHDLLTM